VESATNRLWVLMKFQGKTRKYANKDHKVLHLATDDLTIYSEFKQNYPTWNIDLIESEQEATNLG
jgi:hypothetical protein